MQTSVGRLLIEDALPPELAGKVGKLDKKGIADLLAEVAENHPDQYKEILHKLSDVGRNAAWRSGVTVSLSGLRHSAAKDRVLKPIRAALNKLLTDDRLDSDTRNEKIVSLVASVAPELQSALVEEAKAENNPFYDQIASGARGNPSSFASLRGADLLVTDQTGKLVPMPIMHSYAEGLTPAEYFVSSFGQRRGQLDVKLSTADAGYLGKQLSNAAQRIVVTHDRPPETRLPVGLPVSTTDEDYVGAVLARDAGPYKAGETLTARMLQKLRGDGVDDVLVHSTITDISEDGGISAYAAGRRTRRGLSDIGDNIGLPAAQAISERLSQGVLDCLVEGTKVLMGDFTTKAIEDVVVGDFVMGANRRGEIFPVRVNHVFNNGVQPCVRTEFYSGSTKLASLESTTAHKCLVVTLCAKQRLRVLPIGCSESGLRAIRPQRYVGSGASPLDAYGAGVGVANGSRAPVMIRTWSNQAVSDFLAGYVSLRGTVSLRTSGGIDRLGVQISASDKKTLLLLRELFSLRFGVYFARMSLSVGPSKHQTSYSMSCNERASMVRFAKQIPLTGDAETKAQAWLQRVPAAKWVSGRVRRRFQVAIGMRQCYDIEVNHEDHLFVLENGLIVSNSKHSAGVNTRVSKSGFEYLNRLFQAPENFPEAGPLAEHEGEVLDVLDAPQGGKIVRVGDEEYYLQPGIEPVVKVGDHVEPGDDLSDGTPHPEALVRLRGMGEARRVYTDLLHQALKDSGAGQNRRNVETLVSGLLNWVRVTNPDGIDDSIYDDVVPYNRLAARYKSRAAEPTKISLARGKYLEEPALHYSPGTRLTSKVLADLKKWGVNDVLAADDEPDFEPNMVRGVHSVYNDPDWRVRIGGFYAATAFKDSVRRGGTSDANSTSYIPALTRGVGFGQDLREQGTYGTQRAVP